MRCIPWYLGLSTESLFVEAAFDSFLVFFDAKPKIYLMLSVFGLNGSSPVLLMILKSNQQANQRSVALKSNAQHHWVHCTHLCCRRSIAAVNHCIYPNIVQFTPSWPSYQIVSIWPLFLQDTKRNIQHSKNNKKQCSPPPAAPSTPSPA